MEDAVERPSAEIRWRAGLPLRAFMFLPSVFLVVVILLVLLVTTRRLLVSQLDWSRETTLAVMAALFTAASAVGVLGEMVLALSLSDWVAGRIDGPRRCVKCDYPAGAVRAPGAEGRCPECGEESWDFGLPPRRIRRWTTASVAVHWIATLILMLWTFGAALVAAAAAGAAIR